MAVRDVCDVLVELCTNSDDAYERAGAGGRIDIEVERRRKEAPTTVRVRDFAGGFTHRDMDEKLGRVGGRYDSGLASGAEVRGTNSRGAKDIAALGKVSFESVSGTGEYARCSITPHGEFESWPPEPATRAVRQRIGIPKGTGTVVTLEVDPAFSVPQHAKLLEMLTHLVPLRDILADEKRELRLHDLTQGRSDPVVHRPLDGTERVCETITIAGYPGAEAKLVIKRARKPLENRGKLREGGILIKSKRAVHEATLFAPELEHDPHAALFFGRLRCPYIDELWNEYDARMERREALDSKNSKPIIDPSRQAGLRRDHPFVVALFQEVLKRLRPLVEEERKRELSQRADVESKETRRKLNELEKLATRFMNENQEESDDDRENPTDDDKLGRGTIDHALSPPFSQLIVGHSRKFYLTVNQGKHPDLAVGSMVQIHCETDEIAVDRASCPLEAHPTREGLLRCVWEVRGVRVTETSGITARVGAIVANAPVEVVACERDLYAHIQALQFWRPRYRLRPGVKRAVRLVAPVPSVVERPTVVRVLCDDRSVTISGDRTLLLRGNLGIAECRLSVMTPETDRVATLVAEIDGHRATTELVSEPPEGDAIKIEILDRDYKNQRYRWEGTNKLIIAARHPSIRRYLGAQSAGFPGQEKTQFKVLLAEIVAYAVAERVLSRNVRRNPDEYRDADLDRFLFTRDELVTKFLPTAHESQVPL